MHRILISFVSVVGAASLYAEGTVFFSNRVIGTMIAPVYVGGTTQLTGNGPAGFPAGTQEWGPEFTLAAGSGYSAALLVGPDLLQASPVTTFRTGFAAGFVSAVTATLPGVPEEAPSAQLQMVAWDNRGGTLTSWAEAKEAWLAGETAAGMSTIFTVEYIGGTLNPPPALAGLESFNIFVIPEPGGLALLLVFAGLRAASRSRSG
jgi:hypothetical protein